MPSSSATISIALAYRLGIQQRGHAGVRGVAHRCADRGEYGSQARGRAFGSARQFQSQSA